MGSKEMGVNMRNLVGSVQNRDYWTAFVNTALNLRVSQFVLVWLFYIGLLVALNQNLELVSSRSYQNHFQIIAFLGTVYFTHERNLEQEYTKIYLFNIDYLVELKSYSCKYNTNNNEEIPNIYFLLCQFPSSFSIYPPPLQS